MSLDFNPVELEKIRYQLGVIIKSWPRVNRIVADDYVAYAMTKSSPESIFAILFDDTLLLYPHGKLTEDAISIDAKTVASPIKIKELNLSGDLFSISLQKYQFTDIIPTIEQVYRVLILSHSD